MKHAISWRLVALSLLFLITFTGCASVQDAVFKKMVAFERAWSDVMVKTIQVGDRVTTYMERPGEPEGETIILLHGFSADKDNWVRFIQAASGLKPGE